MKEKFDQKKYIREYNETHYVRIEIKCKPEEKQELIRRSGEARLSLSRYLIRKGLE